MKKIKSLKDLKKLASDKSLDCFVTLAGGLCRSSKDIYYYKEHNTFDVFHGIDGSIENVTEAQLLKSNIGKALEAVVVKEDVAFSKLLFL